MLNDNLSSQANYDQMVVSRIEKNLDKVMPFTAVISFLSAILVYFSELPFLFCILDFSIGLLFLAVSVFPTKISINFKISLIIFASSLVGILSYMHGGFTSAFLILVMIGNIIAVLFLHRKISLFISSCSVLVFAFLGIYSNFYHKGTHFEISPSVFAIQFIVFILYLVLLHVSVYSIRGYLLENISKLELSIDNATKLAYYDQLTGLPNVYKFKDELPKYIEQSTNSGYLIFFNLKNLSLINSIYDEKTGDHVLCEIANIFNKIKADTDLLARISGNEFAFWSPCTSEEILHEKLTYITKYTQEHLIIYNMNKKIEFYISYANLSSCNLNIQDCYQRASTALTYAKTNDLQGFTSYDEKLNQLLRQQENIKDHIKPALKTREFVVYYQNKVNAHTQEVIGVEALARWKSAALGFISPATFIPIIERNNMSIIFGEYIIEQTLSDYTHLCNKFNNSVTLSINISPSHLISRDFVKFLNASIDKYNIPANSIIIEITEDIMIQGIQSVMPILKELNKINVEVALDDFGTGYSSLNYLTQLDINELKIDKTFIDQIETNEKVGIMLEHIINLSTQYGLRVIVEGVETKAQCDYIMSLGCNLIQGYYFSIPGPL